MYHHGEANHCGRLDMVIYHIEELGNMCLKLVESMPKRVQMLIKSRGGHKIPICDIIEQLCTAFWKKKNNLICHFSILSQLIRTVLELHLK